MSPRLGRDEAPAGPVVRGFAAGGFSVEGRIYASLFLTPQAALAWDSPGLAGLAIGEFVSLLAIGEFESLLAIEPQPEFLLLGTGPTLRFPPAALKAALEARGIGIEVMDSRAAARVWGLLRGEGRWIVAALMPLA